MTDKTHPASSLPEDPMLRALYECDQERAAALRQLEAATARLRDKIVAVDREEPERWGWRGRIVETVTSLSPAKVYEALAVADLTDKITGALHAAEVAPALYRIGSGTAGQVVLVLSTTPPAEDPSGLADRIRTALLAGDLVIVPASLRKPTGSAHEQAEALAALAQPGEAVAVIDQTRRSKARST